MLMHFVKQLFLLCHNILLALDFCPYLYDVFFVSLYDAQAASDLYRSICRLCSQPSIEETMSPQELREALDAEDE